MICDDLSEEEIFQAYLLYASLHGFSTDETTVRERIYAHTHENIPDEVIDDALLAYLEDRIVAPPDVVLERWGASRMYELDKSAPNCIRHQTCEAWFENGCRFPTDKPLVPKFAHFWTEFLLTALPGGTTSQVSQLDQAYRQSLGLVEGTRLSLELTDHGQVIVSHRIRGPVGRLPDALSKEIHAEPMKTRKFLPLVDARQASDATRCKLLVVTAGDEVPAVDIVKYAAEAFHAERAKC